MANPITHEATDWKPLESGGTEITAARLNNMDGDITKLSNALGAALQVLSDGQDAATVAVPYKPCWLYDPKTAVMTYVAEDGTRTKPLASAADVKALHDSVSRVEMQGIVASIMFDDYQFNEKDSSGYLCTRYKTRNATYAFQILTDGLQFQRFDPDNTNPKTIWRMFVR